jgi:hypothetical protein
MSCGARAEQRRGVIEVGVAKGHPAAAHHGGGVGGQHGQAETVPKAGLDLSSLELQCSLDNYYISSG